MIILRMLPLNVWFQFSTFKSRCIISGVSVLPYPCGLAENIWKYGSPVPLCGDQTDDGAIPDFELSDKMRKHNDDWRWSVYASRKIAERIRISLQFASDNMSKTAWSPPPPTYSKYTEIMTSKRQWYCAQNTILLIESKGVTGI